MAYNTLTNGTLPDADDVMENFNSAGKILVNYQGTGFNTSAANTTSTASYETSLISATSLAKADYLKIKICVKSQSGFISNTNNGQAKIKIEEKYSGGAYGDILAYTDLNIFQQLGSGGSQYFTTANTIEYVYTLTANDKANGVYLKVTSESSTNSSSITAFCTNVQFLVETGV